MSVEQDRTLLLSERPWLKRDFRDGHLFIVPIDYIFEHINPHQKERLGPDADNWTLSKEFTINELLDSGKLPEEIFPIQVSIPRYKEELTITDGITRLRVFKKRGIKDIRAKFYHG